YVETYTYDAAGNLLTMRHRGAVPGHDGWTRTFEYDAASQLEPDRTGNRLGRSWLKGDPPAVEIYRYDRHGNCTRPPHLGGPPDNDNTAWGFRDQLARADVGSAVASYTYDSAGERTRKVIDHRDGHRQERLYLGALEVFRRLNADGTVSLERES